MVAPMPRASESSVAAVKPGLRRKRAGGEAEIVKEIAEPAGEPDIADFLADLGEAEFDRDAAAGLGFGNAGGGEVGDATIEMILELAVEAALERPAAEPVEEPDHRLPSSKIRLDCAGQARPAILLDRKLAATGGRKGVELGLPAGLRLFPLGAQPAFLLQAVEGWIERALVDLDHRTRDLLQPLRDTVPMGGFEREDLENQHVERALRDGETRRRHRYLNLLPLSIHPG